MKETRLTLLMPVWNSLTRLASDGLTETITSALNSLASQSYVDYELLILDNISNDGTYEYLLEKSKADSRINVFRDSEKRFPEAAIQKLAELSSSKYIAIVNDDDIWDKNYFEILISALDSNADFDLAFSDGRSIDMDGKTGRKLANIQFINSLSDPPIGNINAQVFFRHRSVIPAMFGVFRRDSFLKCLPLEAFDELKANVDNRFMLKFFSKGMKVKFVDTPLFFYRERPRDVGGYKKELGVNAEAELTTLVHTYILHQIQFYILALKISANFPGNRVEKITFLNSTFFHIKGLLQWIKQDYSKGKRQESILREYFSALDVNPIVMNKDYSFVFLEDWAYSDPFSLINNEMLWNRLCAPYISVLFSFKEVFANSALSLENKLQIDQIIDAVIKNLDFTEINPTNFKLEHKKASESKVCVYTCSFNLEKFVNSTLSSISLQKNVKFENLVVDGGSKDESVSRIKENVSAKLISIEDDGFIDGAWKAINHTDATYIAQCCISDSFANNGWLARAVETLDANPDVSLVWGFPQYLSEDSVRGEVSFPELHWAEIPKLGEMYKYYLDTGFFFPEGNFVARTSVYKECLPKPFETSGVEPFLEFSRRFHEYGYLSIGIPVIANFGRKHSDQLSELQENSGSIHKMRKNFLKGVKQERKRTERKGLKEFVNSEGDIVLTIPIRRRNLNSTLKLAFATLKSNLRQVIPKSWIQIIKRYMKLLNKFS